MPGRFGRTMNEVIISGHWPNYLLTLMLHYNTLRGNYNNSDHAINCQLIDDDFAQNSCHPNATMFMNFASTYTYVNDMHTENLVVGVAAANQVLQAQNAVLMNNRAIWVHYGAHSFTLLTGTGGQVESFEAWAGGEAFGGGYAFHTSVVNEPDSLGYPRVNALPTRAQAQGALGNLIAAGVAERRDAVDRLSRAGHGGFGGHTAGSAAPGLEIHVRTQVAEGVFRRSVMDRLIAVGHYRQRAIENVRNPRHVCCRCQAELATAALAQTHRWRECVHCSRHYCRQCKHLLRTRNWLGVVIEARVRVCDCGNNTRRM